jgi:hypothetical protein
MERLSLQAGKEYLSDQSNTALQVLMPAILAFNANLASGNISINLRKVAGSVIGAPIGLGVGLVVTEAYEKVSGRELGRTAEDIAHVVSTVVGIAAGSFLPDIK